MSPGSGGAGQSGGATGIGEFLRGIPKTVALLDAAVAALSATLLPRRFIPENLDLLGPVVSLLVVLCFIVTVRYHAALRRHLVLFVVLAAIALAGLVAMQVTLVCDVSAYGPEGAARQFLVGLSYTAEGQRNMVALGAKTCQDLIIGAGVDRIPAIWGGSYTAAALLYVMTYAGFIVGSVFALGGTGLASRNRTSTQ